MLAPEIPDSGGVGRRVEALDEGRGEMRGVDLVGVGDDEEEGEVFVERVGVVGVVELRRTCKMREKRGQIGMGRGR